MCLLKYYRDEDRECHPCLKVKDLSHALNATKHMIDGAKRSLEAKRQERIEQGEFLMRDYMIVGLSSVCFHGCR